jgi:hypothetical protein
MKVNRLTMPSYALGSRRVGGAVLRQHGNCTDSICAPVANWLKGCTDSTRGSGLRRAIICICLTTSGMRTTLQWARNAATGHAETWRNLYIRVSSRTAKRAALEMPYRPALSYPRSVAPTRMASGRGWLHTVTTTI